MTRREALLAGLGLLAAGCAGKLGAAHAGRSSGTGATAAAAGAAPARAGAIDGVGSTLAATWVDPAGTGVLRRGPGEPLIARTELAPASPAGPVLATLAHVTDPHVLDASSPARVPFLDRLGGPFASTFRPQEALTAQLLAGAIRSVRALAPDAVIEGGDLIDNDQANELRRALDVLRGGTVDPGPYFGVQSARDADPFYYRPDLDAPLHPGLLARASQPFASPGLGAPWYPVLGDHDILVAGEIPPNPTTASLAVGDRAVWELPPGLTVPPGARLTSDGSPDGPPLPGAVDQLLAQALAGPKVQVPADASRRELASHEVVTALRRAAGLSDARAESLDYSTDVGAHARLIVLDLARRAGGSGGVVRPGQAQWLAGQLERAGERWVIVVSHQPLTSSEGGQQLLAVLDSQPRVVAALSGHTHHNRIEPRPSAAGGYWLIQTASLIDYPQQARALRLAATPNGGVAIQTWMLDHSFPGELGEVSRQLAYLDAQGGRPDGFAGRPSDRNATLYRLAARR